MEKPLRFVFAPDVHGSELDPVTVTACLKFTKDFKPDVRVIGGDLWDFAALRAGASEEEKNQSLKDDWESGAAFAFDFFGRSCENHLLLGNHDCRPWRLLKSPKAIVRAAAERCISDITELGLKLNAKVWPYTNRSYIQKGHLKMLHGIGGGGGTTWMVHARAYQNCLFGHCHSIGSHTITNCDGPKEAVSSGCMCRLDMEYCAHTDASLKWENGWAYGFLYSDGTYQVLRTRKIGGNFHVFQSPKVY